MNTDPLDITYVPLAELKLWPGNARQGVVREIKESMRKNGVFQPIVVQKSTNRVIAGNHRMMAMLELHGEKPEKFSDLAPVVYMDVNDATANRMNVADNKTSDDASWDERLLAEQLQAIVEEDGSLEGTGFDDDDLQDLIESLDADSEDGDPKDSGHTENYVERFEIVVECEDEGDQQEKYDHLVELGYTVRVLNL